MSAAAAAAPADAGGAKPKSKSKKKLIIVIVAVLVLLLGGGGAALVLLKKKPPAGEDGDEAPAHATEHKAASKVDLKHPPTFVPLDAFVVNLADKESDRYAQIGITLQVDDAHFGEEMKTFMPAIRNGILMILAHKSAKELQDRGGKELLAGQIQREAARAMGVDVDEPDDEAADAGHGAKAAADADADEAPKKKKKKKKKPAEDNPIRAVLFSNFIIQ